MPTPADITRARDTRERESHIVDTYTQRIEMLSDWKNRVERVDAFLRGDWVIEMPDGRIIHDRPKIENRVKSVIEDTAREAGDIFPAMNVEPPSEAAVGRSEEREQVLNYYHQLSATKQKMPLLFADAISTGLTAIRVWPDFARPPESRYPLFKRVDPRWVLPPVALQVGEVPADVILVRVVKLRDLKHFYPEASVALSTRKWKHGSPLADDTEVEIVEYWSCDEIHFVAHIAAGGNESITETLFRLPNRLGRCPIILGLRPTADGHIRGQADDMLAILASENRLWTYAVDYADQTVYAPIIKKGMKGIKIRFGPNSVIDIPEKGDISRLGPATMDPAFFRIMADLERQSRRDAIAPEARAGDISQSIGSAAFVESLMGSYSTNIRTYQEMMEFVLMQANEVAQLVDKEFCDVRKSIAGYAEGGQFRLHYTPSELIKDNELSNVVTYGEGAGVDAFNRSLILLRDQQAGYISKRYVRKNRAGRTNMLQQENEILNEQALEALMAGILAQASQGNLEPLRQFQSARGKNQNLLEVLAELIEPTALAAGPAPGPGTAQPAALPGEATAGQREAAANTGVPGGGTQSPASLPPLETLLLGG
jgi:hypothetical protein